MNHFSELRQDVLRFSFVRLLYFLHIQKQYSDTEANASHSLTMNESTLQILIATLKADASIAPGDRNRILKLVRGGALEPIQNGNGNGPPRIYSRDQAAEMVGGRTTRYIDQLVRRGLLQKFTPKGNVRSIGITGKSLNAFIAGEPTVAA